MDAILATIGWELTGQVLAAAIAVLGVFRAARLKKAIQEWQDVIGAVRLARADKTWTNEEVEHVLTEAAQAIAATFPIAKRWFK